MKSCEISFGHAALHSYWFVQLPKPRPSIVLTIARTRLSRSGWPWGSRPRWETFAATKSIALEFLQAATHAPHPMHCAASMARSATSFGTGTELASGADPVRDVM